MKKILILLICAVLVLGGCAKNDVIEPSTEAVTENLHLTQDILPIDDSIEMIYSSGAGGWETIITLTKDGSFTGSYHDSEMGTTGEGYTNGTCYVSEFEGRFKQIRLEDDCTLSMVLDYVTLSRNAGEEWIEDEVRYVSSGAWGIAEGERFLFYTPDKPVSEVNTDILTWWRGNAETDKTLGCYGLYNMAIGAGFFCYE